MGMRMTEGIIPKVTHARTIKHVSIDLYTVNGNILFSTDLIYDEMQ